MSLVNTKCDPKSIICITLLNTTIRELLINVGMVIWTFRIISNSAATDCYKVSLQKHIGDWDVLSLRNDWTLAKTKLRPITFHVRHSLSPLQGFGELRLAPHSITFYFYNISH